MDYCNDGHGHGIMNFNSSILTLTYFQSKPDSPYVKDWSFSLGVSQHTHTKISLRKFEKDNGRKNALIAQVVCFHMP